MKSIIMFTGFQESERVGNGFERGFFDVVRKFAAQHVTTYHPRTWKTDVAPMLRQHYDNGITETAILCYSHGQAAAIEFAKRAPEYGVAIPLLLACDPVPRASWLPRATWAQPLTLFSIIGSDVIKVPPSVKSVRYVRQHMTFPRGADFVADYPDSTIIHDPEIVHLPHIRIDESKAWWTMVMRSLEQFTYEPAFNQP